MYLGSFEAAPNAAYWTGYVEVIDDETDSGFDLDDALIEMEVTDQRGCRRFYGSTTDGRLTVSGDGFNFEFPDTVMKQLCAGSYTVNIRITDEITGFVAEPAIATLPVLEGGYR